jgi:phosphoenolpyruvate carboxykinase (GTP)
MRSEATAAAELKNNVIMNDPFAMRPFFGYNFGDYLKHWLSLKRSNRNMPKIFHVNWFRKSNDGQGSYLWPGFGENIRVLEWIFNRSEIKPSVNARSSPIGLLPFLKDINFSNLNLNDEKIQELFKLDKKFWFDEAVEIKEYFDEYVNDSTPKEIYNEINKLRKRVEEM